MVSKLNCLGGYVYILRGSYIDQQGKEHIQFYIGSTNNIERRLDEHESHKSPFTKRYNNVELQCYIEVPAMNRYFVEYRLKKHRRWVYALVGKLNKQQSTYYMNQMKEFLDQKLKSQYRIHNCKKNRS